MYDPTRWPLPSSLGIDQVLNDLAEHAGFYLSDEDFDIVVAERPHLVLAWLSAAGRYVNTDYQVQILERPISWMRDEIGPGAGHDTDDIGHNVSNLSRLFAERTKATAARVQAFRDFTAACKPLAAEGVLQPDNRQWHEVQLLAHGLAYSATVRVPHDAAAPWPLVKATPWLVTSLICPQQSRVPEPGFPLLRRALSGVARVDHHGVWQRLLPDPDGWYLLRDFAWTEPGAAPEATTAPDGQPTPTTTTP